MEYVLIFLGWSLYFFTHSILADNKVKSWFKKNVSSINPFYRLLYNALAILGLIVLILHYRSINPDYLISQSVLSNIIGYILAFCGFLLGFIAFRYYDTKEFFGLTHTSKSKEEVRLNVSGLNRYVRHPLYTATYIGLAGIWLLEPSGEMLIIVGVSCAYLHIGAKLEEKKLIAEFGKDYLQYKERTPMFFPYL